MMNIDVKSMESIQYMVEGIKTKLKMASGAAIKPDHFDESHYEDIRDIYEIVTSKERFSISEMEAIVSELGRLKKNRS